MGAGFTNEAEAILKDAMEKQDMHPNVASTLNRLSELRKNEETKKETLKAKSSELHACILKYANALFNGQGEASHFAGTWQAIDGTKVSVEQNEDMVISTWNNNLRYYRLAGKSNNSGIRVNSVKYGYSMTSNEEKDAGQAFMYLDHTGDNLVIILVSGDASEIIKLNRKME